MKIVWLSPYPLDVLIPFGLKVTRPVAGHACSWIMNWARSLATLDEVDLHIITYGSRITKSQTIEFSGYTVHIIKDAIWFTDRGWAGLKNIDAVTKFKFLKKKFISKIEKIKPDIVHAHGTEDVFSLAAVDSRYPCVISIQGIIEEYLVTNPTHRFKHIVKTERQSVLKCNNFMCRTHFDKSFIKKINPTATIFHMPEPMNPCFFRVERKSSDLPRILHVGGFHERKGLEDLIDAVYYLKQNFPKITVEVVGSGSDKRKSLIVNKITELGLNDNIILHGFLNARKIAELHAISSIFVITSSNENSPNTLAEALCAGTPVVAYNVGGISSMFEDNESGFLVNHGDQKGLIIKIEQLLKSKQLREKFSKKSILDSNSNHPDSVAMNSYSAYNSIIGDYLC